MMDKIKMIDLHRHFYENSELDKANLSPESFLKLHFAISEIYDLDLYTMCGGHDSTIYGKKVWDIYKNIPESKRQNLHLYAQSEFNVSMNEILTYPDKVHNDDKYVYKKAHILAAAKKGKEEEFFEATKIFSVWSDMYIKKYKNKELQYTGDLVKFDAKGKIIRDAEMGRDYLGTFNMGNLLKAARNILCEKYCKDYKDRIPFEVYENTTQVGLTYSQIRQRFIDDSFDYLVSKGLIQNTSADKQQLEADIVGIRTGAGYVKILPQFDFEEQKRLANNPEGRKFYPSSRDGAISRLSPKDFKLLFKDTAHFCVAHPETIKIRSETGIPVSAFEDVNISTLPEDVQNVIKSYLTQYKQTNVDHVFMPDDSSGVLIKMGKSTSITKDFGNIVKSQILFKNLDRFTKKCGYTIEGIEISPFTFEKSFAKTNHYNWRQFDLIASMGKAANCNSAFGDEHLNSEFHTSLIDEMVSRKLNAFTIH